jgi:hypothetical protein
LKALFKVKKCFQGHSPKIKTILHIFDHTIKPILLNGSEIWGSFPAQGDNYFSKVCRDLIVELEAPRSLYSSPGYNNNISQ